MLTPLTLAVLAMVAALGAQAAAPLPAPVPEPAIDGVIRALQGHQLVAITDPHGNAGMRDFLRRLFADPRFPEAVDDIVVEIGNARYQAVVDDYVNGGDVDEYALAEAWLNTTVANQISADVEWFRQIRRINAGRPADRRLRILLGDPPIDWSKVETRADHFAWLAQRDSYPAALIQAEILGKRRSGLIIYGHLHFQRRNVASNFETGDWRAETIVSLIERAGPTRVFTIWRQEEILTSVFPDALKWPVPALAAVAGTSLGAIDVGRLTPFPPRVRIANGTLEPVPKDQYATLPVAQQLDAVLYLGPASRAPIAPDTGPCKRPGFLDERLRRILTLTGIPQFEAENIRKLCGG